MPINDHDKATGNSINHGSGVSAEDATVTIKDASSSSISGQTNNATTNPPDNPITRALAEMLLVGNHGIGFAFCRKVESCNALRNRGLAVPPISQQEWVTMVAQCLDGATSLQELRELPDEALVLRKEHFVRVLGEHRTEMLEAVKKQYPDEFVTASGDKMTVTYFWECRTSTFTAMISSRGVDRAVENLRLEDLPESIRQDCVIELAHCMRARNHAEKIPQHFLIDVCDINRLRHDLAARRQSNASAQRVKDSDVVVVQVAQPGQEAKENVLLLPFNGQYRPVLCQANLTKIDREAIQIWVNALVNKFLSEYTDGMTPAAEPVKLLTDMILAAVKDDYIDLPQACSRESLTAHMNQLYSENRRKLEHNVKRLQTLLEGSKSLREAKAKFRQLRSEAEQALLDPSKLFKAWTLVEMAKEEAQRLLKKEKGYKQR